MFHGRTKVLVRGYVKLALIGAAIAFGHIYSHALPSPHQQQKATDWSNFKPDFEAHPAPRQQPRVAVPTWEELSPTPPRRAAESVTGAVDRDGNPISFSFKEEKKNGILTFPKEEMKPVDYMADAPLVVPAPQVVKQITSPEGAVLDTSERIGSTENNSSTFALIVTATGIFLGFASCYGLFWSLGKSVHGSTSVATGRRWMNWVVLLALMQPAAKFFSLLIGGFGNPWNALSQGVVGAVVLGFSAFVAGAIWSRFRPKSDHAIGAVDSDNKGGSNAATVLAQPPDFLGRQWRRVSPIEAKAHPLYGNKKWLAVFAFAVLYGALGDLAGVNSAAIESGVTMRQILGVAHPSAEFLKSALLIDFGLLIFS